MCRLGLGRYFRVVPSLWLCIFAYIFKVAHSYADLVVSWKQGGGFSSSGSEYLCGFSFGIEMNVLPH